MSTKDFFSEENEVKSSWMQWGKPGDNILGTLVSKRQIKNSIKDSKDADEMQTVYEIKVMSGVFHPLVNKIPQDEAFTIPANELWNVGGKAGIDAQMRNVKIGQILGLKFMEEVPSKTKGFNATKVIKVFTEGKMDEEFLTGMEEEAKAKDPNNF